MTLTAMIGLALAQAAPAPPASAPAPATAPTENTAPKPAALLADGIPPVPADLATRTRAYLESRSASFAGWNRTDRAMLVRTRFANTQQLHRVAAPMMARTQLTFEAEPVGGSWSPAGDVMVVSKDVGGSEFYQLYRYDKGRLVLLTDGKSRNSGNKWSKDGRWFAYTSTRRNGADNDIYIIDPRDPTSDRKVAEVKGGGWSVEAFSPDAAHAVVSEYRSVTNSKLFLMDVATGAMKPIGDHAKTISYGEAEFAPDGTLWVTTDEGSDFRRLGTLDPATGTFSPRAPEPKWDVDEFDLSDDGRTLVYAVNEAGMSRIRVMDVATGKVRTVGGLPLGNAGGLQIAPWGTIGFTYTSASSPADAYAVDPATLKATRWTQSETGGLDPTVNVEPEFVEVKSFDGETVSGFLYRPDPKRYPGRRPLIVDIHGGPEAQWTPGFLGRTNYLINELGIAVFFSNVRGSSGFGKRFVSLDNGPFKREDSVKDIGAFLDRLDKDAAIDPARIAVTGGSYGGYMCYASAIRYGARLKGADCIVAISDFVTFLENTQAYRRDLRRVEYGDERDPAQRAKLKAISPLSQVDRLTIPLMVVTGGNDPRVPASEADQIVKAVRAKGRPAWHLLAQNEGHGFAKKENADYEFWTELMFWQRYLLGDAPPAAGAR